MYIKRHILIFLIIFFLLVKVINANIHSSKDSILRQIQGTWKCSKIIESCITEKLKDTCILPPVGDLYVNGDSLFFFDYPCNFFFGALLFNDGILKFNNPGYYNTRYTEVFLREDTLLLKRKTGEKVTQYEYYTRAPLKKEILSQLKKDSVNIECFNGKWKLITYIELGDGSDPNIKFPFKLPAILDFSNSSKLRKTLSGKHYINIKVDGITRLFRVREISKSKNMLWLEEGKWWKGGNIPYIRYKYIGN